MWIVTGTEYDGTRYEYCVRRRPFRILYRERLLVKYSTVQYCNYRPSEYYGSGMPSPSRIYQSNGGSTSSCEVLHSTPVVLRMYCILRRTVLWEQKSYEHFTRGTRVQLVLPVLHSVHAATRTVQNLVLPRLILTSMGSPTPLGRANRTAEPVGPPSSDISRRSG